VRTHATLRSRACVHACVTGVEKETKRDRERQSLIRGGGTLPSARLTYGICKCVTYAVNAYRFVEQLSNTHTHTHTHTHTLANGARASMSNDTTSPKGDSRENQYGEILSLAECFPGIVLIVHVVHVLYPTLPRLISISRYLRLSRMPFSTARTFHLLVLCDRALCATRPARKSTSTPMRDNGSIALFLLFFAFLLNARRHQEGSRFATAYRVKLVNFPADLESA